MSSKRVTVSGWGSEDELLNENNPGGISAFADQGEFDEDALLGVSDGEGQDLGLDGIGDEELIEVEIEEEDENEWTENAELGVDENLPETHQGAGDAMVHTHETVEPYTETQEHTISGHLDTGDYQEDYTEETTTVNTKLLEDEDSDEEKETNTRERFKSERQQISTVSNRTKPIPESLELEGEAAAAMNKQNQSLQQKPYRQNNRGGFGGNNHYMRGRGGSQQHRPLMQQQPTLAGLNTMHHRQRHQRPLLTQGTMQPLMIGAGVGRPRHQGQRMQMMHHQVTPQQQHQNYLIPGSQQQLPLMSSQPQIQISQNQAFNDEVDYGHPVQHGVHPQQNQPAPRLQTVNYNHGQHRPVASASGSSSTIHVNPHFKGPISMNQPVSRRPLEEAFGFDVSTPQAKPDALSMLSEAATNQRIQQQNVSRNQFNKIQPVNNNMYNSQGGPRPTLLVNQYQDQDLRPLMQDVAVQPQPSLLNRPQPQRFQNPPLSHHMQQPHPRQPFQGQQSVRPVQHQQPMRPQNPRTLLQNPNPPVGQPIRTVMRQNSNHCVQPQPARGNIIPTLGNVTRQQQQQQHQQQNIRSKPIQQRLGPQRNPSQPNIQQQQQPQHKPQLQQQKLPQQRQTQQPKQFPQKPVPQTGTPVVSKPTPLTKEQIELQKKLEARQKRFSEGSVTKSGTAKLTATTTGKNSATSTAINIGVKRLSSGSQDDTSPPKQLKIERTITNEKVVAHTESSEDVYSSEELYKQKLEEQKRKREEIQKRKEKNRQMRADSLKHEVEERQATQEATAVEQPEQQQPAAAQKPIGNQQQPQQQQWLPKQQMKQQPLRQRNVQNFNPANQQGGAAKKKVVKMTKAQFLRAKGQGFPSPAASHRQVQQVGQMAQSRVVMTNQQPRKVISVNNNNVRRVISSSAGARVSIAGLAANTNEQAIAGLASNCGNVMNVELQNGRAIVTFDNLQSAENFKKKYHMHMIELSRIRVELLRG